MSLWTPFQSQLKKLGLRESEFEESFCRSSGPGGQNVNKVATCVELKHLPTGLNVSVQDSRSQATNRQLARERLLHLIQKQRDLRRQHKKALAALRKRRNRPRPPAVKKKILEAKKRRSQTKNFRKKVTDY